MSSSFFPPQVGFIPTGTTTGVLNSTVYLGRNVDVTWEAIGFGAQGRPDYLQTLYMNLTKVQGTTKTRLATLKFDVADIQTIINADSAATAAALTFKLRQVSVCDNGTNKKMIILASDTYV